MFGAATVEKIWQGTLGGFLNGLARSHEQRKSGNTIGAAITRASTFYSYGLIWPARSIVEDLLEKIPEDELFELTHGQCDTVGTIMLRRFFWIKPDPLHAGLFLEMGLDEDPPPHNAALLRIGLAEVSFLVGDLEQCKERMNEALSLREAVFKEENFVQAVRQFTRVLRRAMTLEGKLGNMPRAHQLYLEALRLTSDKIKGSKSQSRKLQRAWNRLKHPHFWHRWYD